MERNCDEDGKEEIHLDFFSRELQEEKVSVKKKELKR